MDCCSDKLSGAVVRVGNSKSTNSGSVCGHVGDSNGKSKIDIHCPHKLKGRYVSIHDVKTVCEVQVMGTFSENISECRKKLNIFQNSAYGDLDILNHFLGAMIIL